MNDLGSWLAQATRGLSQESAAQVRAEIQEHYESSREAGIADQAALTALGDPKTANRGYRRVMLTSAEASLLREGNRAAWTLNAISVVTASVLLLMVGRISIVRVALALAIGLSFLPLVRCLPIFTPERSRLFRTVKWVVYAGLLFLAFGSALRMWWFLILWLWLPVAAELRRNSIRRKLPVEQWPRQLYL